MIVFPDINVAQNLSFAVDPSFVASW